MSRYEPYRSPPPPMESSSDMEKGPSAYAIEMPIDDPSQPLNPSTPPSSIRPHSMMVQSWEAPPDNPNSKKELYDDGEDIIAPGAKSILKICAYGLIPCSIPGIIGLIIALAVKKDASILNVPLMYWAIYAEIFLISFWIGLLLIKLIPFILKPFFPPGSRKYLRFFQNLEVAFAFCAWALATWITFYPTMHFTMEDSKAKIKIPSWAQTVDRILLANCVAAGVYLAKCCLVQLVGYRYHETQFKVKKKEIKAKITTLEKLHEARKASFQEGKSKRTKRDHEFVLEALEKYSTAKGLAVRLYSLLVSPGEEALTQSDFDKVDPSAFTLIDADGNGNVTRDEMISFVIGICRDRRNLITGQTDIRTTLNAFDWLIFTATLVLDLFIYIAFITNSFRAVFTFAGALLTGSAFAFALTIQDLMASIIFVFVKHPYDIGDRVIFDKETYIVLHVSLLYTVFKSVSDHRKAQCSNTILNQKTIDNVSRSENVSEVFRLPIHIKTPAEDLDTLKDLLTEFVEEHSREYHLSSLRVRLATFNLERAEITVQIRYKVKWTDLEKFEELRHKFQQAVIENCAKVPIAKPGGGPIGAPKEGLPGNAQYAVHISQEEAQRLSKEAWDEVKAERYRPLRKDKNKEKKDGKEGAEEKKDK